MTNIHQLPGVVLSAKNGTDQGHQRVRAAHVAQ